MPLCQHGVNTFSGPGCYNCVLERAEAAELEAKLTAEKMGRIVADGLLAEKELAQAKAEIEGLRREIRGALSYLESAYSNAEGCEPESQIIEAFRQALSGQPGKERQREALVRRVAEKGLDWRFACVYGNGDEREKAQDELVGVLHDLAALDAHSKEAR